MDDAKELLAKMNHHADELLLVAKKLERASKTQVVEEEMTLLQEEQEAIIKEIEKIDRKLNKIPPAKRGGRTNLRKELNEKMHKFEKLNRHFIDNVSGTKRVIQFQRK